MLRIDHIFLLLYYCVIFRSFAFVFYYPVAFAFLFIDFFSLFFLFRGYISRNRAVEEAHRLSCLPGA